MLSPKADGKYFKWLKSNHGGKRKGSGRKPDPNKKIRYSTRIAPDLVEWLKEQDEPAAKLIDKAIRILKA